MAVFGRGIPSGSLAKSGWSASFAVHRRTAVFAPPENVGLLLKRRPVPKLDKVADKADCLIAAVFRPLRFVEAVGGHTRPQNLVGGFGVGNFGVARAVPEAQQVARRHRAGFGFGLPPVDTPTDNGGLDGVFDDVAQGGLAGFGGKGTDL